MRPDIEILMLGPLSVREGGSIVHIGGHNARATLAALLISANHPVSTDQLIWSVWGDEPPESEINTIQTYVSRLRQILGDDAIATEDHSYVLIADSRQIDACRFEELVADATDELELNPAAAGKLAREALSLWRGRAFGDLSDEEFVQFERIRLEELRLNAIEIAVEAELRSGIRGRPIARLQALTAEYPYRERFWQLLIWALANAGRRIEATAAFRRYCQVLDEAGVEPGITYDQLTDPILFSVLTSE